MDQSTHLAPMGHEPEGSNEPQTTDTPVGSTAGMGRTVWFVVKAVEIRLRFIAILVGIGLVIAYWESLKNYWDKWTRPAPGTATVLPSDTEYYCPMHPSVVRAELDPSGAVPRCPICGMPLSKRKKGELHELPLGVVSRVQLSPYRIQLAGVRTVEAALRPLTVELRTVGYVTVDERRRARLVVRVAGYVEKLYVNEPFAVVSRGQPLAELYSPNLYLAAQELLLARRGSSSELVELAREKLRLLGVADQEIDEILRTGQASARLVIRAPWGGHVFEKRVVEGDAVQEGQVLFEVVDLSTVWIEGELYEKDLSLVRPGQTVSVTVEGRSGPPLTGRVSLVHPHVQPATRTIRVRFEFENPDHTLRPGMFATVFLSVPMQQIEPFRSRLAGWSDGSIAVRSSGADTASGRGNGEKATDDAGRTGNAAQVAAQGVCPVTGLRLGSMGPPVAVSAAGRSVLLCCPGCQDEFASRSEYYLARLTTVSEEGVLCVPEMAVIDTGSEKVVYVERAPGLFEGMLVTVGPLAAGYYPVIEGLLPGDRVATAGAFLIDAETRLNPGAASSYFGASAGPARSMAPSSSQSRPAEASAQGAHRLPSSTKQNNLARLPPADRQRAERQGTCPITGLVLGSMGVPHKMTVKGQVVFLCCQACEGEVNQDPQGTMEKLQRRQLDEKRKAPTP